MGNSRLGCPTLEAGPVPGKVVLTALCTCPVPRLDVGVEVCEPIPALLHEEAGPVLAPVPCIGGGPPGIGGAEVCWHAGSWGDGLLLPYQCTGLCTKTMKQQLKQTV